MADTILVNVIPGETRVAVLEAGRAVELLFERPGRESRVGQVFLGRVQRILPGMQAAFVEIGLERAGFLSLEAPVAGGPAERMTEGQAVVVQVAKDAIGRKGVQLTRRISIAGRDLVLTPMQEGLVVSRRIGDEAERDRLARLMAGIAGPGEGFILRTNAAGATAEALAADADLVRAAWDAVEIATRQARPPALVYRGPDALARVLIEFAGRDTERVVIDDPAAFAAARKYCERAMKDMVARLELHEATEPLALFETFGIEHEIEQALAARVRLASGGEVVVEGTEALTAIDVNTGSLVGTARQDDAVLRTNLEAAAESARQLRLRSIGGLVVIDFVQMDQEEHWRRVLGALGGALARDRSPARILGRTVGGLVEVTRRRGREPIATLLAGRWRAGEGETLEKTAETVAFDALRAVRREALRRPGRVRVTASAEVAGCLEGPARDHLAAVAAALGREVAVESESGWPRGRFEIALE